MITPVLYVVLFFICSSSAVEEGERKPKLFYVSTTSTTSTYKLQTVCYVTSTKATAACGRKKRFVQYSAEDSLTRDINPSNPTIAKNVEDPTALDGSESNARNGRFLVYWMTTTSVSTLTSYTTTLTVASLTCTPSSFALSLCGKK